MSTTPEMVPRQQQRRTDDERWALIEATLRAFDKRLLTLQQRTDDMAPAMQESPTGWEISKTGLTLITLVIGLLSLVASGAVAWNTSQNALSQKVDERRFERDSSVMAAEHQAFFQQFERITNENREFRAEALSRLKEICLGVRTGCR